MKKRDGFVSNSSSSSFISARLVGNDNDLLSDSATNSVIFTGEELYNSLNEAIINGIDIKDIRLIIQANETYD